MLYVKWDVKPSLIPFIIVVVIIITVTINGDVVWCDQVQLCQLADQRVVVDQLKQITSTMSHLVGADSTSAIRQLTDVDMDKYLSLTQTFSNKSHQLDVVYRQANDVMSLSVHVCHPSFLYTL